MRYRYPRRQKEKPHCRLVVTLQRDMVAGITTPGSVGLVSIKKNQNRLHPAYAASLTALKSWRSCKINPGKGSEDKGISPKNKIMYKRKDSRQLTYLWVETVDTNNKSGALVLSKRVQVLTSTDIKIMKILIRNNIQNLVTTKSYYFVYPSLKDMTITEGEILKAEQKETTRNKKT